MTPVNPMELLGAIKQNIRKKIIGKDDVIDKVLICLVCGGHALIEDMPGLGKTTLISALAESTSCSFRRLQFTPDVLPSDITGFHMLNIHNGERTFHPGAVSSQILLADEINRTGPKTQSALLQAMQEGRVSVDSETFTLPAPFLVFATQNPIEMTGTYPLPEAQLDRFLFRISIGYPDAKHELNILDSNQKRMQEARLSPICSDRDVLTLQRTLDEIRCVSQVKSYIISIANATRRHPNISLGLSPRGSIALMRAAMGRAMLSGREFVIPDDVQYAAVPVIAHRLVLAPGAYADSQSPEEIVRDILTKVPVPGASAS